MTQSPARTTSPLADALLAHSPTEREEWLQRHQAELGLPLIGALKAYGDAIATVEPAAADEATLCALLVAERCVDEPLALPLAAWARANYTIFHDPQETVRLYLEALEGYRRHGDPISVARLLSNLVFPYTECGRLPEAEVAADEARTLLEGAGEAATYYLIMLEQNVGWLYHNQQRYADALAAYGRALTLAYAYDDPRLAAELHVNRSLTLQQAGRLGEEEELLLESRRVAARADQHLTVARIDMNLGELYAARGQPTAALRRLHAAGEAFAALGNATVLALALLFEAGLLARLGALAAAHHCYERARERFAARSMHTQVGVALLRDAAVSRRRGDHREAAALLEAAADLWQQLGQPQWRAAVAYERAELALARGECAQALALLRAVRLAPENESGRAQRAVLVADASQCGGAGQDAPQGIVGRYEYARRYAQQHGDRWLERRALAGLGRLLLAANPPAARSALEAAAAIDDATRQALSVEELKASFQATSGDVLPLLVQLALGDGDPLQALRYVWRAKGSALLELAAGAVAANPDAALAAAIDQIHQQLALQRRLEAADAANTFAPSPVPQTVRDLEAQLVDLRRRRNEATPAARLSDPALTLAHMHADVLLEYFRCDGRLLAIRADRSGAIRAAWLAPEAEIIELLAELQLCLQNVLTLAPALRERCHGALMDECLPFLAAAYNALVAPLGPFPPEAQLCIAPCDPLYLLPFAALWDGQQFLCERHVIQLVPCGALVSDRATPGAFGPPLVIGATAEGRLPGAASEAWAVAASVPGSVCLVDDPTALRVLRQNLPPRLLHIAAHSQRREDAPIFSALVLSGEALTVEQCYDLPLTGTALVTLSGCTTATGLDTGGSLLAFQSALHSAGAHAVVSSLWLLDDAAAVTWMECFYKFVAEGYGPPAALQRCQQTLLSDSALRHPALWAAFACSQW